MIEETHTFLFVYYIIDADTKIQLVHIVVLFQIETGFIQKLWARLSVNIYLRHFLLPVLITVFFPKVIEHFGNGAIELPSLCFQ